MFLGSVLSHFPETGWNRFAILMIVTTSSKLTATTSGGGCASKLSPKILDRVLAQIPRWPNENVLVGFDTADDAGVYKLTPEIALVQTVDFFSPVVDDPHTFGAIAAANALSDIWAMGGRSDFRRSRSWRGRPRATEEDLLEIVKGGAEKMHEAAAPFWAATALPTTKSSSATPSRD